MRSVGALGEAHDYRSAYNISVGGTTLALDPHDWLTVCWKNGLDTPCSICKQHFNNGCAPPVRTLRLHQSSSSNTTTTMTDFPLINIINTHLSCLKAENVKFFPISHAWHEPVARAYASREFNVDAARLVFELPVRILVAASQRFGPDVQIWHDYISIPQWQDSFRGTTILPQIFQIFKYGETALIHLDDEPTFDAHGLSESQDLNTLGLELQCLFSARWFCRMWIIVEFTMCRESYVMNSRFEIMARPFSFLIEQLAQIPMPLPTPLEWMTTIPLFCKDRSAHNCLGHVYDLLANQGCRSYRDYFIAACATLEQDDEHRVIAELPEDAEEACLWLSKRALQRGDYSPLLLRPSSEPPHEKVRWLKGHRSMDANMWGLGIQTKQAHSTPKLLPDHSVELELHFLGNMIEAAVNNNGETIFSVQCPICESVMLCRVFMWQKPKDATRFYCIPGLAYRTMQSERIGIVVEDARVIGRVWPGVSSCHCNERACIRIT